jgi:hypothetical protein
MGIAVSEEALERGAEVTLVYGHGTASPPTRAETRDQEGAPGSPCVARPEETSTRRRRIDHQRIRRIDRQVRDRPEAEGLDAHANAVRIRLAE